MPPDTFTHLLTQPLWHHSKNEIVQPANQHAIVTFRHSFASRLSPSNDGSYSSSGVEVKLLRPAKNAIPPDTMKYRPTPVKRIQPAP